MGAEYVLVDPDQVVKAPWRRCGDAAVQKAGTQLGVLGVVTLGARQRALGPQDGLPIQELLERNDWQVFVASQKPTQQMVFPSSHACPSTGAR